MANKVEKVMCGAGDLGIACGGALALGGVVRNSDLQSNATQGGSRKMNNMKKLMFAAAAIAAGIAVADVTSANIVGYQNKTTAEGTTYFKYPFVGPTFECITDSGNFKLGDIKVSGMKGADYLYILNTENATPDTSTYIVYMDATAAEKKWGPSGADYPEEDWKKWIGWWKAPAQDYPDDENPAVPGKTFIETDFINDATFLSGTAFLGFFQDKQEVVFTYSGAAQGSIVNIPSVGKKYPMVCNPIPRDVILRDVKVTGMKGADYFYKLNRDDATVDTSSYIVYMDATAAEKKWGPAGADYPEEDWKKWIGWWKAPAQDYPDDENPAVPGKTFIETDLLNKDTDVWSAGESFIGFFQDKQSFAISFPKAVPDKAAE